MVTFLPIKGSKFERRETMVLQHNIFLVLLSSAVIGKLTPFISDKVGYYLKKF